MKESKHPAFTAAKGRRPRSLEYILLRISSEKPSRRLWRIEDAFNAHETYDTRD
ncbi:40c96be9-1179-48b4-8885-9d6f7016f5ec [Thermothielavioides terrestris]|uniref:40c96be9-1179-48b4-8885-9d6f7016f5ec n=1 Tax=Thermothielavioides terrestris TaxID=2587410 RepID=A0A3S4CZ81_9PEZI|nr:40c96be9-1179-48b4-8885-9d6f7016f5ec [Thermothielavioides terrestris]